MTPGHVLVIPSAHVADATDNPDVAAMTMRYAAKLARDSFPCNIITSAGVEATQTVRHLHIHVVPRRAGDGLMLPWSDPAPSVTPDSDDGWMGLTDEDLEEIHAELAPSVHVRCDNCEGIDPASCINAPSVTPDSGQLREAMWDVVATVRDAAPRRVDDAESYDIVDALLSGPVGRLIAERDRYAAQVQAVRAALTDRDRPDVFMPEERFVGHIRRALDGGA